MFLRICQMGTMLLVLLNVHASTGDPVLHIEPAQARPWRGSNHPAIAEYRVVDQGSPVTLSSCQISLNSLVITLNSSITSPSVSSPEDLGLHFSPEACYFTVGYNISAISPGNLIYQAETANSGQLLVGSQFELKRASNLQLSFQDSGVTEDGAQYHITYGLGSRAAVTSRLPTAECICFIISLTDNTVSKQTIPVHLQTDVCRILLPNVASTVITTCGYQSSNASIIGTFFSDNRTEIIPGQPSTAITTANITTVSNVTTKLPTPTAATALNTQTVPEESITTENVNTVPASDHASTAIPNTTNSEMLGETTTDASLDVSTRKQLRDECSPSGPPCSAAHSLCKDGRCMCDDQHYIGDDFVSCLPKKDLGSVCGDHSQCGASLSSCVLGTCQCFCPYVANTNGSACIEGHSQCNVAISGVNLDYHLLLTSFIQDQIKVMDLRSKGIQSFQFAVFNGFPSLVEVNLDGNILETLSGSSVGVTRSLNKLSLRFNVFEIFDFSWLNGFNWISTLDLSHNRISQVSSMSVSGLAVDHLILRGHRFTSLVFSALNGFSSFRTLDLSHGLLTHLQANASDGATFSIDNLYLNDNNLMSFELSSFQGFRDMSELDVRNNQIITIDLSVERLYQEQYRGDTYPVLQEYNTLRFNNNPATQLTCSHPDVPYNPSGYSGHDTEIYLGSVNNVSSLCECSVLSAGGCPVPYGLGPDYYLDIGGYCDYNYGDVATRVNFYC